MASNGYTHPSAKRIQKELAEIALDPPCNCSAGPKGDNIYEWVSTILGPDGGSCFDGLVVVLCSVLLIILVHTLSKKVLHMRGVYFSSMWRFPRTIHSNLPRCIDEEMACIWRR